MTLPQAQDARIVVITAGLRQPSTSRLLADRLAAATAEHLPHAELEMVELREYAHDLTNHLLTGFPSAHLAALLDDVAAADALIAVSPVFSGSYSGLFKTLFDVLPPETLAGTPVLIGATGGTARHSLVLDHALRPLFSYLHAVVVPTGVYAAPEDWGTDAQLGARIDRAARELASQIDWAARELAAQVPSSTPRAPGRDSAERTGEDEVVDFQKLLGGLGQL